MNRKEKSKSHLPSTFGLIVVLIRCWPAFVKEVFKKVVDLLNISMAARLLEHYSNNSTHLQINQILKFNSYQLSKEKFNSSNQRYENDNLPASKKSIQPSWVFPLWTNFSSASLCNMRG
jgi:hypothetical protein